MALTVQNLRAVGVGVEPASLLPGQIAFNITDKVIYVGDGSNFKTNYDGTQVAGVPGNGWYAMPMDFDSLGSYYVINPEYYGDVPTDGQVLSWSTALNHTIWSSGAGGGSQVYVVSNAAVAAAPGATTSAKITAAIGVASPDEGNVTIVTGLPDDVYEGLYFFTTEWVKGAAYAYPSASEVIYDNTAHPTLSATVQGAIDDLDDGLAATAAIANTANSTANSALSIASAALPKAGGTMTGNVTFSGSGIGVVFTDASAVQAISNSVNTISAVTAASSTAVKTSYDLAAAAVPRSSYTAAGDLIVGTGVGTFNSLPVGTPGQILSVAPGGTSLIWVTDSEGDVTSVAGTLPITVDNTNPQVPVVGVNPATTATSGVVQIDILGNINVAGGLITVPNASTTVRGAVQLYNGVDNSSTTLALTAAQGKALQDQIDTLTLSNSVILAGGYDASTGLVDGVTSQGAAVGFVDNAAPPAASSTTVDHYVICTKAGTIPSTMANGDWLLVVETAPGVYAYQVLGVGARPAVASYTQVGVTQLADGATVLAGTSDSLAITPQALQDNVIDSVITANSNLIASATAVKTANDNAVAAQTTANAALPKAGGTMTGNITFQDAGEGVVFNGGSSVYAISDSTSTTSSTTAASSTAAKAAYDVAAAAIPCSLVVAKGNIVAASAAGTPVALPVGTNGQVLVANSACSAGLEWVTDVPGDVTGVNATFPVTVDNTDPQQPVIGINGASTVAAGAVQLNDTVTSTSMLEAATANAAKTAYDIGAAAIPCSSFTALGNLLAGTGSGTYSALTVGTNGQFLSANSACGTGLEWCTLSLACVPCSAYTAVGTILAGNGAGTYCSLPVGTNGQVLVPNSACAAGVEWITCQGVAICGYTCTATPFNTAIGANAGDSFTFGVNNTLLGYNAGTAITGGLNNTFVGFSAGDGITSSDNSVAVGSNALGNTGGNNNTAVGYCTGGCLTSGGQNTFIGGIAGYRATTLDNAVAVGYGAMGGVTTGTGQVAVGSNALAALTSGAGNVAVGYQALDLVTTGGSNTAVGHQAGTNVATNVNGNTLIGFQAGTGVTTGGQNTLVGNGAGSSVTTGANNTILGNYNGTAALANNVVLSDGAGNRRFQANSSGAWSYDGTNFGTAGQFLASQGSAATPVWCTLSLACVPCSAFTAAGQLLAGTGSSTFTALSVGTDGQFLVADSTCTGGLKWATECFVNDSSFTGAGAILAGTGVGSFSALTVGTNGQFLTVDSTCANGVKWVTAPGANISGFTCSATPFNTVVGSGAGAALTSLSVANTAFGYAALDAETSGDFNVAIGHNALTAQNGASGNTVIGGNAGAQISSGSNNTLIGCGSGDLLTTGAQNVALGVNTLGGATTGSSNIAIGFNALAVQTTTSNNVAIGTSSGANVSSGTFNTFTGGSSGQAVTSGSSNTYFGYAAGCNATTGSQNSILGSQAHGGNGSCNVFVGYNSGCSTSASGNTNTAIGWETAKSLTSGANNTFVGQRAGQAVGAGAANTFVGQNAGGLVTTGGCNTLIGAYQGATTLSNNVVLSDGAATIRFQSNSSGAWSPDGTNYGTSGQFLTSAGTGAVPTWSSSLPQVTAPAASTDAGTQGQIASDSTYFYMYTGGRWQRIAWDATVW